MDGAAECIGFDDIGAGFQVLLMNACNDMRLGNAQQVVIAFHIDMPVFESFAAIIRFCQVYNAGSWCPWRHR